MLRAVLSIELMVFVLMFAIFVSYANIIARNMPKRRKNNLSIDIYKR